jgi:hypothetical protein
MELGSVVEAHLSASLANEGAIPLRVFDWKYGAIVLPKRNEEQQEGDRSSDNVDF